VWGGLHALYLVSSQATRRVRSAARRVLHIRGNSRSWRGIRTLSTFSLTCVAWIFFRASSLADAWYVVRQILGGGTYSLRSLEGMGLGQAGDLNGPANLLVALVSLGMMVSVPELLRRFRFFQQPFWLRWFAYGVLVMWVILFSTKDSSPFLYARY